MRIATHAISSALVLGSSVSAASMLNRLYPATRGFSTLARRDNAILGSSTFSDECVDVCLPIWRKFEDCAEGDWNCLCAGDNGAKLLPCVNCFAKKDPALSGRAAAQRLLDFYSEGCGNPAGALKIADYVPDPTAGEVPAPSKVSKTPDGQSADAADAETVRHRLLLLPEYSMKHSTDRRGDQTGRREPDPAEVEESIQDSIKTRGGAFVFSYPMWKDELLGDFSEFEVPSQERRELDVRQNRQEGEWEVLSASDHPGIRFGVGSGTTALHLTNSNTLRKNFTDDVTIHFHGTSMDLISTRNCTRSCAFTYTLDGGDEQTVMLEATSGSVDVSSLLDLTDLAGAVHVVHLKNFNAFISLDIHHALVTPSDDAEFSFGLMYIDRNDPAAVSRGSDNGWPGSLEGSEVGQGVNFGFSGDRLWALGRWITDAPPFSSSLSVELHNTGDLFTFPLRHFEGVVRSRAPFFMPFAVNQPSFSSFDEEITHNATVLVAESGIPSESFELIAFVYRTSSKVLSGGGESSAEGGRSPAAKGVVAAAVGLALLFL